MSFPVLIVLIAWAVAVVLLFVLWRRWTLARRSRERVFESAEAAAPVEAWSEEELGWLSQWLFLAGYRGPGMVGGFVGAVLLGLCVGVLVVITLLASGMVEAAQRELTRQPRVLAELLRPVTIAVPWLLLLLLTVLPVLVVRDRRRRRVELIEQDLPLFLELLATLGESGLGFDASLDRILSSQPQGRPLAEEFRQFQVEVLAGRPRVRCLRRLARRMDVTSFTVFVSAMVQSEQVGTGVADVLRRQADDLRDRRRERALALAATLPVKLVFPLIICFLPAIFVFTLGPTFNEFFKRADAVLHQLPSVGTPR